MLQSYVWCLQRFWIRIWEVTFSNSCFWRLMTTCRGTFCFIFFTISFRILQKIFIWKTWRDTEGTTLFTTLFIFDPNTEALSLSLRITSFCILLTVSQHVLSRETSTKTVNKKNEYIEKMIKSQTLYKC